MTCFKGSPHNLTVIAVCASNIAADNKIKSDTHYNLQKLISRVSRRDVLFVGGKWNARSGTSKKFNGHVLNNFGLGQPCENSSGVIGWVDLNRMFICSIYFQHPKRYQIVIACKMYTASKTVNFGKRIRFIRNTSSKHYKRKLLLRDAPGRRAPEKARKRSFGLNTSVHFSTVLQTTRRINRYQLLGFSTKPTAPR